jgi:hypothetical protein
MIPLKQAQLLAGFEKQAPLLLKSHLTIATYFAKEHKD